MPSWDPNLGLKWAYWIFGVVPSIYKEVHGLGYNMRNGYGVCRGDEMLAMFIFGEEPPPVDYGPLTSTGKL